MCSMGLIRTCVVLSFFSCYRDHRNLHSFPTRRSSDLRRESVVAEEEHAGPGSHSPLKSFWPGWSSGPCPSLMRSEEHTSELQSHSDLVCRLLLEKKKQRWLRRASIARCCNNVNRQKGV